MKTGREESMAVYSETHQIGRQENSIDHVIHYPDPLALAAVLATVRMKTPPGDSGR